MTSEKQIAANQKNAKKSTGPKSDEGKDASKANAVTHGLTAETVLLSDEDPAAYESLRDAIRSEYSAKSAVDEQLIERLVSLLWRLRRVPRLEASLLEVHRLAVAHSDALKAFELYRSHFENENFLLLQADKSSEYRQLENDILKIRNQLAEAKHELGRAFLHSATSDSIGKLSRYERSLIGHLELTLKKLEPVKKEPIADDVEKIVSKRGNVTFYKNMRKPSE